jgi:hypothetical protein
VQTVSGLYCTTQTKAHPALQACKQFPFGTHDVPHGAPFTEQVDAGSVLVGVGTGGSVVVGMDGSVEVVVCGSVEVVVGTGSVVVVMEVVVVLPTQAPFAHASQQLAGLATHAVPPLGGVHFVVLGLISHFDAPFALVRQQVTNPGFPHVEWRAQLLM